MQDNQQNKRIAKNTLLLYLRMIFLLCISLYTSRIVLQTLGVEDYGIYNVVGGVVAMFAFLNNAMASATQRYLNFDLAKHDEKGLSLTFNASVIIHTIIALVIILLSETIGLWFLYEKMEIPEVRMNAAVWVFQCSIMVMAVNVISVPYNAAIIAHEKMGAFAYISIVEALSKLFVVYLLCIMPVDKLKLYAILLLLVSVFIRFVYTTYSHRHFTETHFRWKWNSVKIKEMGTFACWNLVGNLALMGVTQGLNIILNVFFGPVVNAARGVAVQVQNAIQQFATNFQTAINPQITKSYASGDYVYMHSLICRGSKFTFLLIWFFSLPIFIMTEQVLSLWLKTPPDYTETFLRIMLITIMVDCLSNPLNNAVNASGNIRIFQMINGGMMLLVVPVSYVFLKIDANPSLVFVVQLLMTTTTHFFKLYFTKIRTDLSIRVYAEKVYLPLLLVILSSFVIPFFLYNSIDHNIQTFILTGIVCVVATSASIYWLGLENTERMVIKSKVYIIIKKL